MKVLQVVSWVLRATVAVIFIQTLYFKFTAHPDSVYIFSQLGVEPYGRIGLGVAELVVAIMILLPRTMVPGILLSFGIICGAILSHLIVIGTEIMGDSGGLFTLALVVFAACLGLFGIHREEVMSFLKSLLGRA